MCCCSNVLQYVLQWQQCSNEPLTFYLVFDGHFLMAQVSNTVCPQHSCSHLIVRTTCVPLAVLKQQEFITEAHEDILPEDWPHWIKGHLNHKGRVVSPGIWLVVDVKPMWLLRVSFSAESNAAENHCPIDSAQTNEVKLEWAWSLMCVHLGANHQGWCLIFYLSMDPNGPEINDRHTGTARSNQSLPHTHPHTLRLGGTCIVFTHTKRHTVRNHLLSSRA